MAKMTKKEKKAFNKSYQAYRRDWYYWKNKGYSMDINDETGIAEPLSKDGYLAVFKANKKANMKNISATIAKSSRAITHKEALDLKTSLEREATSNADLADWMKKNARSGKQLLGLSYTFKGEQFTGKQGLYLALKDLTDYTVADKVYGY